MEQPAVSNVFVSRALRKDIPSNAIILTKDEALKMHWKTLNDWRPRTDTWPFNYGIGLLSSMNCATSLMISNSFRNRLKLMNYGSVTMSLPTCIIPALTSTFAHYSFVSNSILLGEDCPICVQTRAAIVQVGLGVAFPLVVTPIAAFFYASAYGTYGIPPLKLKNLPELFNIWLKITRKTKSVPAIIGVNAIAAFGLAYFQIDSFYKVQSQIYEREENFKKMMAKKKYP